jgi:hypothetical protein
MAEILYETAERLIAREDEHVSIGALRTILPVLKLAAHAGNRSAQKRYGFYVLGYFFTDSMFWPSDKVTAADALAMLHIVASDAPEEVGDNVKWIVDYRNPVNELPFPKEWVDMAKRQEADYRKCLPL